MATTINSYSVGLTLNASEYIKNSDLSRKETQQLSREINNARNPQEKFTRSAQLLDKALAKGAISAQTHARLMQELNRKYKDASQSSQTLSRSMSRMATRFLAVGAAISIIKKAILIDAEMKQAGASFEVFTGSVAGAESMIADMRKMAEETPLSFRGIAEVGKTMMAFNVPAARVEQTLRRLGDITGGNADRFKMLGLAYSQASAAGRLMGQDLLQMINAGFNPLQEISRKTGRSLIDLKDDMSKGLISFAMVEEAFRSATDEGGRFNGMMDKIGETSAGALARAQSKLDILLADLGNSLAPVIIAAVEAFEEWSPAISSATEDVAFLASGVAELVKLASSFSTDIEGLLNYDQAKFGTMIVSSPLSNLRAMIDYGSAIFTTDIEKMAKARDRLGSGVFTPEMNKEISRYIKLVEDQKKAIESAKAGLDAEGAGLTEDDMATKEQKAADKLNDSFNEKIKNLERELDLLENVGEEYDRQRLISDGATENQAAELTAIQKQIDLLKEEEEQQKRIKQEAEKTAAAQSSMREKALDNARKAFDEEIERQKKIQQAIASTAISSIEADSSEASKFMSEQFNRELSLQMPDAVEPTNDQLVEEARKQYELMVAESENTATQTELLKNLLEEAQKNGVKRFR
jgi:tape measure domain-containing protein